MANLHLVPCTIADAKEFVRQHHRHLGPPVQDGYTAEVTRVAVLPGVRNACSLLYGAAWRACRALGYQRLVTYTLGRESGTSLRAAGWRVVHQVKAESWSRAARPRVDHQPAQRKLRWEVTLG